MHLLIRQRRRHHGKEDGRGKQLFCCGTAFWIPYQLEDESLDRGVGDFFQSVGRRFLGVSRVMMIITERILEISSTVLPHSL